MESPREITRNLSASVGAGLMFNKFFAELGAARREMGSVFISLFSALVYRGALRQGKVERLAAIVADLPSSVRAHSNYATALTKRLDGPMSSRAIFCQHCVESGVSQKTQLIWRRC